MDITNTINDVLKSFEWYRNKDKKLLGLFKKLELGTCNYEDARQYAVRIGTSLERAYKSNIELSMLDYESILKLLDIPIKEGYKLIGEYVKGAQTALNTSYGLGVQPLVADYDAERVEGIAKALTTATEAEASRLIGEDIIIFAQSIVDDSVHKNAKLDHDLGLKPQIIRTYEGQHREHTNHKDGGDWVDCDWCKSLEGVFDYEKVKNLGNDVYKRHRGCRCSLEYTPNKYKNDVKGNAFIRW